MPAHLEEGGSLRRLLGGHRKRDNHRSQLVQCVTLGRRAREGDKFGVSELTPQGQLGGHSGESFMSCLSGFFPLSPAFNMHTFDPFFLNCFLHSDPMTALIHFTSSCLDPYSSLFSVLSCHLCPAHSHRLLFPVSPCLGHLSPAFRINSLLLVLTLRFLYNHTATFLSKHL